MIFDSGDFSYFVEIVPDFVDRVRPLVGECLALTRR